MDKATWQGCDHRFAHRPSSPHRSLWHATQRHHHAVDPRKNHLMSLQSWHEAGSRDPLVQGGKKDMCQVFCIKKSIVNISPVWRSKKNQSRINRSRAASQVHINAPFRKLNVRKLGTRILLPPALLSKQQDSPQLPQWIVNPFRTTQAHQTRSVLST